ncbi:hypothetical protein CKO15_05890 [Halorhodospira abdelmalekii]|uniref:hypothetical protein n=1 Tax=Halorhodospira abdelmalekii TaxID=421629 RepID=UPI001907BCE6|nr:hypothetical protein [Halorhodospira abdelmalekii]MBK1734826.1 hypothetical protein [Halorhodospira abdelmalekii]
MTDIDPAGIHSESARPSYGEHLQEQRREEALRSPAVIDEQARDRGLHGTEGTATSPANAPGEAVAVTAHPNNAASTNTVRNPEQARELAAETRDRILESPREAVASVRDTAQEPGATRISRAIEALS